MDRRAVTGAVVAHHALDGDPVGGVEGDRSPQEAGGGGASLVVEHFDVGQARGVVDADMHELPTLRGAAAAGTPVGVLALASPGDAMTNAGDDPELLDVDMDQLARPRALVAVRRLGRLEPGELAQPDPGQDRRHRRERHRQRHRDLRAGHPQPTQRRDHLNAILARAMRHRQRHRGAVQQPRLALDAIAPHPLAAGALADAGSRGRPRQRPPLLDHPTHHRQPTLRAERRVSVNPHPVPSLEN